MCLSVATTPASPAHALDYLPDVPGQDPALIPDGRSAAAQIRPVIGSLDRSIGELTDRIQGSTDVADDFAAQVSALRVVDEAIAAAGHGRSDQVDLTKLMVEDAEGRKMDARSYLQRAGVEFAPRAPSAAERAAASITGQPVAAPKPTISRNDLTARIDAVTEQRTQATSQNQLGMMRLQELLHQRNLILQLTSNRIAAEEQTARALVGNIR